MSTTVTQPPIMNLDQVSEAIKAMVSRRKPIASVAGDKKELFVLYGWIYWTDADVEDGHLRERCMAVVTLKTPDGGEWVIGEPVTRFHLDRPSRPKARKAALEHVLSRCFTRKMRASVWKQVWDSGVRK